jgi:electron transfer flavoprotein beta subunit
MKILVPVKRVPDPYGKVGLTAQGEIDAFDLKWVVNPFDEIALEEAVRIRENGASVEITAVSIGGADTEPILRTALAMGADRALLILEEEASDPRWVAALLHAAAVREQPDLVLMGKQAIDDDNSQVGPRLAARLAYPQATFASKIAISADGLQARVTREVDSGQETLHVALPAVITTDLRLNEPRYVALPAILKARSKPMERISAGDLGLARPQSQLRTVGLATPPERKAGRKVGSVAELVAALRNEAKVI